MAVIPFYGADDSAMFAIERRAMDRDGLVIAALDSLLPAGRSLDVGAGDGFTAMRLRAGREVVAMEPDAGMIAATTPLAWVRGEAAHLPFRAASFDAAYATWAYFFSRDWDPTPGIAELDRVVVAGGPLAIVDNLGGDAFAAMADAETLLAFFFGERERRTAALEIGFRVGVFTRSSRGA